jgi:hypothetical protein
MQEALLLKLMDMVATEGIALAMPMHMNFVSRDKKKADGGPDGFRS